MFCPCGSPYAWPLGKPGDAFGTPAGPFCRPCKARKSSESFTYPIPLLRGRLQSQFHPHRAFGKQPTNVMEELVAGQHFSGKSKDMQGPLQSCRIKMQHHKEHENSSRLGRGAPAKSHGRRKRNRFCKSGQQSIHAAPTVPAAAAGASHWTGQTCRGWGYPPLRNPRHCYPPRPRQHPLTSLARPVQQLLLQLPLAAEDSGVHIWHCVKYITDFTAGLDTSRQAHCHV